jgi:hypothetical protein
MNAFSIPWRCLDDTSKPPIQQKIPVKTQKSFAQALSNVCDIPASQFPQPCFKGDKLAIPIPDDEYLAGVEACKHNLHGRIVWPKGSTPLTVVALKNKLTPMWNDLSRWGITSLGKGFYEFSFSSLEDVRRVRSVASWNLNPGFLKLFAWTSDFNPNLQRNTSAQVWVSIYGLSQEYWRPKILFAIASGIGTPICTDAIAAKPMFDRTFGHFARVLVDMDISQAPLYQVLVERKGYAFFVDLEYENLPEFCTHCNIIGHYVEICKKLQGKVNQEENQAKEDKARKNQKGQSSKQYVKTRDGRIHNDKSTPETTSQHDLALQSTPAHLPTTTEPVVPVDKSVAILNQQNMFSALADTAANEDVSSEVPILEPIIVDVERNENTVANMSILVANVDVTEPVTVSEDDESPHESDFVEDTPPLVDKGNPEDLSLQIVSQGSQQRIQHDMHFLRESWANMADDEELERNFLEDLEVGPDPSKFTLVTSKASKRAAAAKNSSSKSTYGTRSKVVAKKTFR